MLFWNEFSFPTCLCVCVQFSEDQKEARASFGKNWRLRVLNELMLFLSCVWKGTLNCFNALRSPRRTSTGEVSLSLRSFVPAS